MATSTPRREGDPERLVVFGASSGGIEVLRNVLGGLPRDFPAAVFVVVHLDANSPLVLPKILDRAGPLPAVSPRDGEEYRPGVIYIARPDLHLLLEDGRIVLRRGPRENLCRPAVDPLFRSAALVGGDRTVGVILSGNLNDGTAGLAAIKRCGGTTVAQDPEDALWPDMPQSAIEEGVVDHVVSQSEMPAMLERLARSVPGETAGPTDPPEDLRLEHRIAAQDVSGIAVEESLGSRSYFTCPECHGPLWEMNTPERTMRFRCHVGHAFTAEAMLAGQGQALERALWSALQGHQQRSALTREMARKARDRGQAGLAANWEQRTREYEDHAEVIRRILIRETEPIQGHGGVGDGQEGEVGDGGAGSEESRDFVESRPLALVDE